MDNFLKWSHAPSDAQFPTPIEDDSSNFLRDEILQTQQLVIDKLDEQKINESEEEDKSMDDSMLAMKVLEELGVEARRLDRVRLTMTELQKDCRNDELRLVSLKQNHPKADLSTESFDKTISDMIYEVSRFQNDLQSRESEFTKTQAMSGTQKEEAKRKMIKLRESYSENLKQNELLRDHRGTISKLKEQYNQALERNTELKKKVEAGQAALKLDESKLEKLNDESASMRARLVQLETERSKNGVAPDEKAIERIKAETEQIRLETSNVHAKIEAIKAQAAEVQKIWDLLESGNSELEKEKDEAIKALVTLLCQKFEEDKEKARKEDVARQIQELKSAINGENAEVERVRQEMEELFPGNVKNLEELKKKISTMEANNQSKDKKIRKAVKENDKLIEEIAKMNVKPNDSIDILNQTEDIVIQEKGDVTLEITASETWKSAPRLPLDVTPIQAPVHQREPSIDVITGIPPVKEWMTSTPLHRVRKENSAKKQEKPAKAEKVPKESVQTRGAARRRAETGTVKTENIRKKRGKN